MNAIRRCSPVAILALAILMFGALGARPLHADEPKKPVSVSVLFFEDFPKDDPDIASAFDLFLEGTGPVMGVRNTLLPKKWDLQGEKCSRVLLRLNLKYPEDITVESLKQGLEEIKSKIITSKPVVISVIAYPFRPKK